MMLTDHKRLEFVISLGWRHRREAFFTSSQFCHVEEALERTLLVLETSAHRLFWLGSPKTSIYRVVTAFYKRLKIRF